MTSFQYISDLPVDLWLFHEGKDAALLETRRYPAKNISLEKWQFANENQAGRRGLGEAAMAVLRTKRFCLAAASGGLWISLSLAAAPAPAQSGTSACDAQAGSERVACLRQVLADAQRELDRAEKALGIPAQAQSVPTLPHPAQRARDAQQLGHEQVARRAGVTSAEEERFAARIISAVQGRPNRLTVSLDNGQVWRQLQSDTQVVELSDKQQISAEIWRSGFGGYRMRLLDMGRVLRVERLR
jgi:hypothetical protein